ncbi:hypothetical protein CYLTODRAFT_38794 [Cylindrobasidium torrendii FP15055 ss-10]|uniref:HNH nuclease domain-containing protein n=1 Tax=Cylindrobasidium torrendii FP15055 ss-10 TaxID=1314674 RepID=A0A0D7BSE7_9AGAR|nr:hypothetical protein CYLTODRAFT_38794 [Cylindrobasidium torrendii FP15055 ss-10]
MMSVAWDKITQTSIASSSHSPSINQTAVVVESADRAEQKEFADQLKLRERYQCIVTGYFLPSAPEPWILLPGVGVGELEAAHIIPLALNSDKKPPEPMAPTWDMLKHWTQIDPEDYAGGRITCPENGVLLTKREHHAFGTFKLWFDPVRRQLFLSVLPIDTLRCSLLTLSQSHTPSLACSRAAMNLSRGKYTQS